MSEVNDWEARGMARGEESECNDSESEIPSTSANGSTAAHLTDNNEEDSSDLGLEAEEHPGTSVGPSCTYNSDIECQYSSSDNDEQNGNDINSATSFKEELAEWVSEAKVTRRDCGKLLTLLRNHGCDLPKDRRTLLKTPRSVATEDRCGGKYVYFGMKKALHEVVLHTPNTTDHLSVKVNVDGIPLYKSASTQFWPLLITVNSSTPLLVALWIGSSKPKSLEEFMEQFIEEAIVLQTEGIRINDQMYSLSIDAFICDAPARSFLKNVIAHNGLHACERCTAVGKSVNSRTTFNKRETFSAEGRTDQNFNNLVYIHTHQHGPTPLTAVVNCVSGFALDYMHLICLGVVRRILHFLKNGDRTVKLSSRQILQISERLISLKGSIPSEFARQPRSLLELDRWKATEFRQLLLYTGPVVLKGVISPELYKHFVSLSVAVSILLMQDAGKRNQLLHYAKQLLKHFVTNSERLYGNNFLVYNVHNLLHLADDVSVHNCSLNELSAFPFENFLQTIKKSMKCPANPLVQVCKRIEEYQSLQLVKNGERNAIPPKCKYSGRNSFVRLRNGNFAKVLEMKDHTVVCEIARTSQLRPFFTEPCSSDLLDIFYISASTSSWKTKEISLDDISSKALKLPLPDGDGFVLMPFLHQLPV